MTGTSVAPPPRRLLVDNDHDRGVREHRHGGGQRRGVLHQLALKLLGDVAGLVEDGDADAGHERADLHAAGGRALPHPGRHAVDEHDPRGALDRDLHERRRYHRRTIARGGFSGAFLAPDARGPVTLWIATARAGGRFPRPAGRPLSSPAASSLGRCWGQNRPRVQPAQNGSTTAVQRRQGGSSGASIGSRDFTRAGYQ